jgi:uncharacterized protein (TIGR00255 family)
MLRSMTGFGGASGSVDGIEYSVEVRSVNNRYFKGVVKLPESWAQLETEIENLLRSRLPRGTVTLTVRMRIPDDQAAYRVNTVALGKYINQLREFEIDANPTLRIELGSLLLLPGVCVPPPLEELVSRTHTGLMRLVGKALDELIIMRDRDGQAVKTDMLANCRVIENNTQLIAAHAPEVLRQYHQNLTQRVSELTASAQLVIDSDSLAREVAIYAERCDIAEELARLKAHLEQFRRAIDSPEPAGRKLDFIAQEMLREANTVASKSNDAQIALAVVDIKTAIDRLKEQAANVE